MSDTMIFLAAALILGGIVTLVSLRTGGKRHVWEIDKLIAGAAAGKLTKEKLAVLSGIFAGMIANFAAEMGRPVFFPTACLEMHEDAGLTKYLAQLPGAGLQQTNAAFFSVAKRSGLHNPGKGGMTLKERCTFIGLGSAVLLQTAEQLGLDASSLRRTIENEQDWREYAGSYLSAAQAAGIPAEVAQMMLDARVAIMPIRGRMVVQSLQQAGGGAYIAAQSE